MQYCLALHKENNTTSLQYHINGMMQYLQTPPHRQRYDAHSSGLSTDKIQSNTPLPTHYSPWQTTQPCLVNRRWRSPPLALVFPLFSQSHQEIRDELRTYYLFLCSCFTKLLERPPFTACHLPAIAIHLRLSQQWVPTISPGKLTNYCDATWHNSLEVSCTSDYNRVRKPLFYLEYDVMRNVWKNNIIYVKNTRFRCCKSLDLKIMSSNLSPITYGVRVTNLSVSGTDPTGFYITRILCWHVCTVVHLSHFPNTLHSLSSFVYSHFP